MTHDQLFQMIHARPFRPYRLKTAGGREIAVTHPEAIAYAGERTAVVVLPGDRFEILDIDLVESIEGTNEPAPTIGEEGGAT
ncbi:MAG: hypothetical protein WB773_26710 [Isosphaeraceae bacterium]